MTDVNRKGQAYYQRQRRRALGRDGGACVVCGRTAVSVHHRQGRGGKDPHRLSNLITVCGDGVRGHHGEIHANPSASYALGRMVPRLGIRTPEDTPVLTRSGWVLLDNDGGITATTPMKETT